MTGPPTFHVPDVDPLELGAEAADGAGGAPAPGGAPDLTVLPGGAGSLTVAQVRELIDVPFAVMAVRRGPHWRLARDEGELIAEPLARMINGYALAARALGTVAGPLAVAGALGLVITARLLEDADHAATDRPGPRTGRPGLAASDDAGAGRVRAAGAPGDFQRGDRLDAGRPRSGAGTLNGGFVVPGRPDHADPDQALPTADPWDVPGEAG